MELEKLFEVKMRKLLIVGLMLVASGSVYSSGKEYTLKYCDDVKDINRCDKCVINGKISFRINKSQDAVMEDLVFDDGRKHSTLIDNCKIFDDDFECKSVSSSSSPLGEMTITNRYVVSNGKWIQTSTGDLGLSHITTLATCGEEIK